MASSAPPCALIIFGASGDLAKRKLLPAVYEMLRENMLPQQFSLLGYSRTEMSDDQFRKELRDSLQKYARMKPIDEAVAKRLESATYYIAGDYGTDESHMKLAKKLREVDEKHGTAGNRLFYLSTPPQTFEPIIKCLGHCKPHYTAISGE